MISLDKLRPKISVVLSVYNVENYIHKCMETVLGQTLKDIEVIMVDDGSPDSCPQICDDYAKIDNRVRVIHKKNAGLGMARNSGMKIAKGEYICFLDPDDFFDLNMLSELYTIAKNNNLQAVYTNFIKVDKNGKELFKITDVTEYTEFNGHSDCHKIGLGMIGTMLHGEKSYSMSCAKVLFNLDFLKENNLFFESERKFLSEDMIFDVDFYNVATKVAFTPTYYYYYRANPSSLSQKVSSDLFLKCKLQYYELLRRLKLQGYSEIEHRYPCHRYIISCSFGLIHKMFLRNYPYKEIKRNFELISTDDIWINMRKEFSFNLLPFKTRLLLFSLMHNKIWIFRLAVYYFSFNDKQRIKSLNQ